MQPAPSPFDRAGSGVTFDELRGRPIVVGGIPNDIFFDPIFEDTWELADGAWRKVSSTLPYGPEPSRGALVYDPVERLTRLAPSLAYNGSHWTDTGLTGPTGADHTTVYDRGREVVVMIQGNETWELAAGAWTQVDTVGRPPLGGKAVYDRERDQIFLMADTVWEYDTSVSPPTWTNTGVSVPSTASTAVAYSTSLGQTVAFGGGRPGNLDL